MGIYIRSICHNQTGCTKLNVSLLIIWHQFLWRFISRNLIKPSFATFSAIFSRQTQAITSYFLKHISLVVSSIWKVWCVYSPIWNKTHIWNSHYSAVLWYTKLYIIWISHLYHSREWPENYSTRRLKIVFTFKEP